MQPSDPHAALAETHLRRYMIPPVHCQRTVYRNARPVQRHMACTRKMKHWSVQTADLKQYGAVEAKNRRGQVCKSTAQS
jgi:hypothetical protein